MMKLRPDQIDSVRVLVIGDQDVGKTCLTYLLAYDKPIKDVNRKLAKVNVEVRVHEYQERTKLYFIEFYDVNLKAHSRLILKKLLNQIDAIILVYDLSNMTSHDNLHDWIYKTVYKRSQNTKYKRKMPKLVVGTKWDLVADPTKIRTSIAQVCGLSELRLNCFNRKHIGKNSENYKKLQKFYDEVIQYVIKKKKHATAL